MPTGTESPALTVKTQLTLPRTTLDTLTRLSAESGTSVAELVRAAIATDQLLREAVDKGGRVLIVDHEHGFREVDIPR